MIFEWDEEKRRENLRKHGFDFADAAATIRLISVRKASRHEKARYFANLPD